MGWRDSVNKLGKVLEWKTFTPRLEDLINEEEQIVIFSDTHLGWEKSKKREFERFLDYLKDEMERGDLDVVVANGDIVELWRRDDFKVLMENLHTLGRLSELGEKCKVYWIVGNHDYVLKELFSTKPENLINFPRELILKHRNQRFRFVHGDQYDPTEVEWFFIPLCKGTNDLSGELLYEIGGRVLGGIRSAIGKCFAHTLLKTYLSGQFKERSKEMLRTPEERGIIKIVERNAKEDVKSDEFLIFSHTHRALVDQESRVANPGSWVEGSPNENTYLTIRRGKVELNEY